MATTGGAGIDMRTETAGEDFEWLIIPPGIGARRGGAGVTGRFAGEAASGGRERTSSTCSLDGAGADGATIAVAAATAITPAAKMVSPLFTTAPLTHKAWLSV